MAENSVKNVFTNMVHKRNEKKKLFFNFIVCAYDVNFNAREIFM